MRTCEGVTHLPVDDGHFDDVPRLVEHEVVVPGVAVLQTPEAKKEDHSNILLRVLLIQCTECDTPKCR